MDMASWRKLDNAASEEDLDNLFSDDDDYVVEINTGTVQEVSSADTVMQKFVCDYPDCSKGFKTKGWLVRHQFSVHNIDSGSGNDTQQDRCMDIGKEDALRLVEKAIGVWAADEINIYTEKGNR